MDGCELAFHVAGVNTLCPADPVALFHINVRGTEAVVRAAARAGIRRIVYTSSAAALGEERGTVGDESSPHRGSYLSAYERSKHEGEIAAFDAARHVGVDLVSVNPSSVQGPGRAGGTGRILIAYLNGRLKAFVDTQLSLVDIRDCTAGHLLAAERGRAGARYVLNGATVPSLEALEIVSELTGVRDRPRMLPGMLASFAAALSEDAFLIAGRPPPFCREMVRTLLHGHRYDGSRATRELGLVYTPLPETLARTVEWAVAEGLVKRPLPSWPPSSSVTSQAAGYLSREKTTTMEVPMERDEREFEREREAADAVDERLEHKHPADPVQTDSGFAEGVDTKPDTPAEELEPDFARGIRSGPEAEAEVRRRFSEGIEQEPEDAPDKNVERRFSEGIERSPTSE
jgi:dihydroflavonol-4-reductase